MDEFDAALMRRTGVPRDLVENPFSNIRSSHDAIEFPRQHGDFVLPLEIESTGQVVILPDGGGVPRQPGHRKPCLRLGADPADFRR